MTTKNKQKENSSFIQKLIVQFAKFGLIGVLNTGLDFFVLNILLWATGVYSGSWVILFNVIAFTVAVINSYVLNKKYTFNDSGADVASQFTKFVLISLIGLVVNTAIVFGITTYIDPLFGLGDGLWANGAKIVATAVALVWNFIGYKLWAFRENTK